MFRDPLALTIAGDEHSGDELERSFHADTADFSKAERGKFYRQDAEMRLPIYLDTEVQARKGEPVEKIVNGLLRREMEQIESGK